MELSAEDFEDLVADALDEIPPRLTALLDNVVILIEEEPPEHEPDLLGLYVGTPITERGSTYTFYPPDQVFVFRGPLTRMCRDADELRHEVSITVVHELAHFFGIDDRQLHEWGWG